MSENNKPDLRDAENMVDIIKSAPEGKRDLVRLALAFYSRGMSDCLALDIHSAANAPTRPTA